MKTTIIYSIYRIKTWSFVSGISDCAGGGIFIDPSFLRNRPFFLMLPCFPEGVPTLRTGLSGSSGDGVLNSSIP